MLTKNPNLRKKNKNKKKIFFFGGGGGGGLLMGVGVVVVNALEQMFRMALLLFKENICAKLF